MSRFSDGPITQEDAQEIMRLANIIYFRNASYERTTWMGKSALKCPLDMWVYQEIIYEKKVDLLIETGTFSGGSALFFAHLFDLLGNGKVLSVDIQAHDDRPEHPRIEYVLGESISESVIKHAQSLAEDAQTTMVLLDSDHKADYKLKEMQAYADLVSTGSYLIAEDSNFDYFPAWPEYGPGPTAAIEGFLKARNDFEVDRQREKHLITFAPKAFLQRVKPTRRSG